MKYKCIIFDCDGVLVDSETLSNHVLVQMLGELGLEMNLDEALDRFAGQKLHSIFVDIEQTFQYQLPSRFELEYRQRSQEQFSKHLQPIEGIESVLKRLPVPICVASNGPVNKIQQNLSITGLARFFGQNIFSAYDIGKWKPSPELFLHAARTMGYAPQDCAVVEDSISGVQAGISGGFDVYAFCKLRDKEKCLQLGAQTFRGMRELFNLL